MTEQSDAATATPAEADSPFTAVGDPHRDPLNEDPDAADEPDPDLAEEYAESLPVDPTPEQVEHYLELAGAPEALSTPDSPGPSSQA
jgi:hypothetical protein